ncbi:hypothetical protein B5S32_g257 [[Candida] boidinii]|nr:hypothetical protein B5S32_g257 [[Candida] boidinii]
MLFYLNRLRTILPHTFLKNSKFPAPYSISHNISRVSLFPTVMSSHQQTLNRFFQSKSGAVAVKAKPKTAESQSSSPVKREIKDSSSISKTSRSRSRSRSPTRDPASKKPIRSRSRSNSPKAKKLKTELTPESEDIPKTETLIDQVDHSIEEHKKANELEQAKKLLNLDKQYHKTAQSNIIPLKKGASKDQSLPYSALANVFEKLEQEPGRLKNLAIASEFYLEVLKSSANPADDLIKVTYLMINRLGPDYEPGLELGLGETLLIKAISTGTGRSTQQIKADYHEAGDIGVVALKSRKKQSVMFKAKPLTIDQVFNNLTDIAKLTGNSSQARKIGIINKMLTACEGEEAKFLMRSLEGKLRINFGEKSVLVALAKAFVEFECYKNSKKSVNPEHLVEAEEKIKDAFSQTPNYELIIKSALEHGIRQIHKYCILTPGIPLKPMLAKPTKSVTEILDQFQGQEFTCEYKYDGERAQLHLLPDGKLKIYSRNSEDMTERYPDLVGVINELKKLNPDIKSMVLDSECVAWDKQESKILPFQVLSTRKRKDVQENEIKVQVCLFVFDILLLNGEPLLTKPLKERRKIIKENLKLIDGKLQIAKYMNSSNIDEIQHFLDKSVKDACEGLMIKTITGRDSYYEPSKRSRNWLKLKKDYLDGVGDSLDLVVVGGYIGKGKRTGWYGGFLLACYNQDTGEYETVCKIGTGFSEELLQKLTDVLKPTEIANPKSFYVYDKENLNSKPDTWFEPTVVFEVLTADLTESPTYRAGVSYHGDGSKGISLRFPRFIRLRDDKGTEDATSSEQLVEFYERQANLQG